MYLYHAIIYHNTTNVVTLPANNTANVADFEDNHKSTALKVDGIEIIETTFEIDKTYEEFDALITGDIDWSDVRYEEHAKDYCLYLTSDNPL